MMTDWPSKSFKLIVKRRFAGEWGGEEGTSEVNVPCIRVADFNRFKNIVSDDVPTVRSISKRTVEVKQLQHRDILIEKSGGGEKTPVGTPILYLGSENAICSNFIEVVRLKPGHDPRFWTYVLISSYEGGNTRRFINQTTGIQNIDSQRFYDQVFHVPPLETQQRIADYLDRETAEIDAAVADLDTHVELLKKRRRLVVTKAVAGDVGPGKGFSESWDQVPLRAVSADGGLFVDGDWVETKDQDPNGEIRLTQLADVGESVFLDKSDRWVNESKFEELGCTEVFPGDLLIARMPDPIARCTVMPDGLGYPAITVVDVAILRAGSDWNNRYVMWAINSQSFRNDVDSRVSGSTRQRISRSALGRTKLFRPPLEIQQQIADYLDRETAEIDSLIAESTKLRNLLLKRRSVLITEVVTGRKQV